MTVSTPTTSADPSMDEILASIRRMLKEDDQNSTDKPASPALDANTPPSPELGNVIALDADPTGGLSRWAARLYEGPTFTCHHEADEARLAHLIHRVAQEADVVVVDTAGFGNRAATVAMTAADAVLIPMVPGEGDVTEAARTVELVAGVASAARREIPSRVVMNRVRSSTALSRHAAAEAGPLPKLATGLSDLVAYGEMGFSGRMPAGKAGAEAAALIAELRAIGFLPWLTDNTSSVKTKYGNTQYVKTVRAGR
jgi:chromosome partitioning protein